MSQKMQNVENNPVLKFVGSGHLAQMYGNLGSGKSKNAFNLVDKEWHGMEHSSSNRKSYNCQS